MRAVCLVPILSATLPVIGSPTREPHAKAKRRKLSVPVPMFSNCFTSGILDSQDANKKPLVAKVTRLPLRALSTVLEWLFAFSLITISVLLEECLCTEDRATRALAQQQ
jgi:hypothetical protein